MYFSLTRGEETELLLLEYDIAHKQKNEFVTLMGETRQLMIMKKGGGHLSAEPELARRLDRSLYSRRVLSLALSMALFCFVDSISCAVFRFSKYFSAGFAIDS